MFKINIIFNCRLNNKLTNIIYESIYKKLLIYGVGTVVGTFSILRMYVTSFLNFLNLTNY